jgi:hypothetical protein
MNRSIPASYRKIPMDLIVWFDTILNAIRTRKYITRHLPPVIVALPFSLCLKVDAWFTGSLVMFWIPTRQSDPMPFLVCSFQIPFGWYPQSWDDH